MVALETETSKEGGLKFVHGRKISYVVHQGQFRFRISTEEAGRTT